MKASIKYNSGNVLFIEHSDSMTSMLFLEWLAKNPQKELKITRDNKHFKIRMQVIRETLIEVRDYINDNTSQD